MSWTPFARWPRLQVSQPMVSDLGFVVITANPMLETHLHQAFAIALPTTSARTPIYFAQSARLGRHVRRSNGNRSLKVAAIQGIRRCRPVDAGRGFPRGGSWRGVVGRQQPCLLGRARDRRSRLFNAGFRRDVGPGGNRRAPNGTIAKAGVIPRAPVLCLLGRQPSPGVAVSAFAPLLDLLDQDHGPRQAPQAATDPPGLPPGRRDRLQGAGRTGHRHRPGARPCRWCRQVPRDPRRPVPARHPRPSMPIWIPASVSVG